MSGPVATIARRLTHVLRRPFGSGRRTITVLELSGDWLKLARVQTGAGGKHLLHLVARPVALQEASPQLLRDVLRGGMGSRDPILISIPRNLVTVRHLQLPTTDPNE